MQGKTDGPDERLAVLGAAARPVRAVSPATLEAALRDLPPAAAAFARASGFAAKPGTVALLPGEDGLAGALYGLGDAGDPFASAALATTLPDGDWRLGEGFSDPAAATLGFLLGAYRPRRTRAPTPAPRLVLPEPAPASALAAARITWLVRDLINTPANRLGPRALAEEAAAALASRGFAVRLIEGEALAAAYPAIAAVGAGAARPAVVLAASLGPAGAPLVALCGKGVVFDTGGLDLKPAAAMLRMKKDMAGAAVALGVALLAGDAGLPLRLELRLGCVENAIGPAAMRPLDVIATRQGLEVEIGNTDAEGRLVLADLLTETSSLAPRLVLDFATLTGAARTALGPEVAPFFCNNDVIAAQLMAAGQAAHDPLWRMPLWPGYDSWLDTATADLGNVSASPHAGAIVAALFLQRFVAPGVDWAHFDIYGWNDSARPGRPEGGDAPAMRAALAALAAISGVAS